MRARRLAGGVAAVIVGIGVAGAVAGAAAVRIVAEWEPGISAADAGGGLSVDGYGVGGLGFYSLGESGTTVLAVCVQADVGHSLTAEYTIDAEPAVRSAELDYLLWRYAGPGGALAGDVEAAALNVLSWRYANAHRSSGGPVWRGPTVDVAVAGRGRLLDVERAVVELAAEATARRGPWTLTGPEISVRPDGGANVTVRLAGPGGPIASVAVAFELAAERLEATTNADGVATVRTDGPVSGLVRATAIGPAPARSYSAPGSQRLAVPTPVTISAERTIAPPPPPTTTTTTPPTTSTTTTTTTPPTTSTTSTTTTTTLPPTTTTTTAPPATTTTAGPPSTPTTTGTTTTAPPATSPPSSTPPPSASRPPRTAPTLPRTGSSGGAIARWASWSFLAGSLAILAACPNRRSRQHRRAGTARVAR